MSGAPQRPAPVASQASAAPAVPPSLRRLPSELLFGGRRVIEIEHRLQFYRLRCTAAGKLILTNW
jgi:hemin uptake protein HemP